MRILLVVHGYPPTHTDGAELRAERTARGLVALGHTVHVVCAESVMDAQPHIRWNDRVQDGVTVRRLFFNLFDAPNSFELSYNNPQVGNVISTVIQKFQPDVVHLFSGYLMTASVINAAEAAGIPVVVSLTDYWWHCHRINLLQSDGSRCNGPHVVKCARCHAESFRRYRLPARAFPWGAERLWNAADSLPGVSGLLGVPEQVARAELLADALAKATLLIAPSRYLAQFYVRHGTDAGKMHVARQGVNLRVCPLRTSSPALRVGYLGQIKPHKGVDLVVQAWQLLGGDRPRTLTIYGSDKGDEAYGQHIRDMLAQTGNTAWKGRIGGPALWEALAELDVLVVPSRWAENSPNSILEAQAMGVPVVGSNLGGVAELVQHEHNGLVFTTNDAGDLAHQLQRLLDTPGLLERLRKNVIPFRSTDDELAEIQDAYAQARQRYAATHHEK